MSNTRIALDVMGGDHAPRAVLRGARMACAEDGLDPARLLLVGDADAIASALAEDGGEFGGQVLPSEGLIGMDDAPAKALREKPRASLPLCVGAVKSGAAGAAVSAGNTGALVGAATLGLGTLAGVRRPALAVTLALGGSPVTFLDMGANPAPKTAHLLHNAVMGAIFARDCLGVADPRVGLLNIGSEPHKGTSLLKEAHELLAARASELALRFEGNVEGNEVFADRVDVVVTDGFTGNVVLKLLEGFSGFLLELVLRELEAHQAGWAREVLGSIQSKVDYAEYGGALLIGVDGVVVKAHGRSDEVAIRNAIGLARRALDASVNEHIEGGLSSLVAARAAAEGAADGDA